MTVLPCGYGYIFNLCHNTCVISLCHIKCTCILFLPSDGSGSYNNFKNFANIRHYSNDFGLDCEWNLFSLLAMSWDLRTCPESKATSLIFILYNADLFVLSLNL